jgi:hypothetical protein
MDLCVGAYYQTTLAQILRAFHLPIDQQVLFAANVVFDRDVRPDSRAQLLKCPPSLPSSARSVNLIRAVFNRAGDENWPFKTPERSPRH